MDWRVRISGFWSMRIGFGNSVMSGSNQPYAYDCHYGPEGSYEGNQGVDEVSAARSLGYSDAALPDLYALVAVAEELLR